MLGIKEFKELLNKNTQEENVHIIEEYENDERKGIQSAITAYKKNLLKIEKEKERVNKMLELENNLYIIGYNCVAGIDEVGRGPLAGPVVTACVVLPKGLIIEGINDSKKLSEANREILYDIIMEKALSVSIGIIDNNEIDDINILQATLKAMKIAYEKSNIDIDYVLIDGNQKIDIDVDQETVIKGDSKSISIAAASIIAKVTRDRMMKEYSKEYPVYDFENNKGYGAAKHLEGIEKHGITPIHRKSFLKNIIK